MRLNPKMGFNLFLRFFHHIYICPWAIDTPLQCIIPSFVKNFKPFFEIFLNNKSNIDRRVAGRRGRNPPAWSIGVWRDVEDAVPYTVHVRYTIDWCELHVNGPNTVHVR